MYGKQSSLACQTRTLIVIPIFDRFWRSLSGSPLMFHDHNALAETFRYGGIQLLLATRESLSELQRSAYHYLIELILIFVIGQLSGVALYRFRQTGLSHHVIKVHHCQ